MWKDALHGYFKHARLRSCVLYDRDRSRQFHAYLSQGKWRCIFGTPALCRLHMRAFVSAHVTIKDTCRTASTFRSTVDDPAVRCCACWLSSKVRGGIHSNVVSTLVGQRGQSTVEEAVLGPWSVITSQGFSSIVACHNLCRVILTIAVGGRMASSALEGWCFLDARVRRRKRALPTTPATASTEPQDNGATDKLLENHVGRSYAHSLLYWTCSSETRRGPTRDGQCVQQYMVM